MLCAVRPMVRAGSWCSGEQGNCFIFISSPVVVKECSLTQEDRADSWLLGKT